MKKKFTGLYTAMVTPFCQDGSFDEVSFSKIIEHQIEGGVDGIVVLGTTGESPTITAFEYEKILRRAVELVDGRIMVIGGAGSNSTQEAIEHSLVAKKSGVDGLLQVNPYYNKPTQKGLYAHFKAIADRVEIPLMLYNILGRTGVNLETSVLLELAKHPNIVSVKEASGNWEQMQSVIEQVPSDFSVLVGDDALTFDFCKLGGDGVVSVASNILPGAMQTFVQDCLSKNWEKAEAFHKKYQPFFEACFIEPNPQPIKTLMAESHFCEPVFRLPMLNMDQRNKQKLLEVFEAIS